MNALKFMDKQIMDLSRSKSDLATNTLNNNNNTIDFIDLMNPQSEEETDGGSSLKKNHDILPSYDFQPIHRPAIAVSSIASDATLSNSTRAWNSLDSKPNSSPLKSYSSLEPVEPDKIIMEKAQKVNDSAILSEIDRTVKKYTDSLLHAIDGLSARLSQLESRTRHLEHSMDDLKLSVGNNHGITDGKMRQLENILLEVQTGVQNLKDKQDVMEGHMQSAKLQILKVEQSSESPNPMHLDTVQQAAAAAAAAASAPQQSNLQQFPTPVPQPLPPLPLSVPPPPQQHIHHPPQQNLHPPPPGTTQFPPSQIPHGPQRDAYFPPPGQTQEALSQMYQIPPPAQHQQQPPTSAPQPQPYQPNPPYPPPPRPPQQQHPSVAGANPPPQFQPPLGHQPEESPHIPAQTYPPNRQPTSQPSSVSLHSQPYFGSSSPMYEQPPSGRSTSGLSSTYGPPSGPNEPYPYGGPPSHYGSSSSVKPLPLSPGAGGGGSNYPQIPTARILPPAIPTASGISGGSSSSGGNGNRVPIDDVIDKVTNMGFPREHVRGTVRKLTENGQSVDLNVVLDKLMNDGEVQPQRDWFGR